MSLTQEMSLVVDAGFVHGIRKETGLPGMTLGSKNMVHVGPGRLRRWAGMVSHTTGDFSRIASGASASAFAFLCGGKPAVTTGKGMASRYRDGFVVFTGDSGVSLDWGNGSKSCTGIIQIDDFTGSTLGGPGPLGLPVPAKLTEDTTDPTGATPPTSGKFIMMAATASGKIHKSIAVKISTYRTETHGQSWTSQASDPMIPTSTKKKVQVNLPAVTASYPGTIKYKIHSTLQGFGVSGFSPFYYYGTYDEGLQTLNFQDVDLLSVLAPYSSDQSTIATPTSDSGKFGIPPKARFVTVLGAHVLAIGCWGTAGSETEGHLIHPSQAFKMENFDPDTPVLVNPSEPILGIVEAMNDGFILIVQANGISAALLTGSSYNPVIARNVWYGWGAPSANQVCTVAGEIWLWSKEKGLLRSGPNDQPESSFADPVREFLEGFTGNPVIGHDPATDRIVVAGAHSNPFGGGAANCAIAYERGLGGDLWSAPQALGGLPITRLQFENKLYLCYSTAGFQEVYPTGAGSGSGDGVVQFFPQHGGAPAHLKTVTKFALSADDASTADVYMTYGHSNATARTHTGVTLTEGHSGWLHTLNNKVRAFSAKIVFASGTPSFEGIALEYLIEDNHA